jgi:hypothetical protein
MTTTAPYRETAHDYLRSGLGYPFPLPYGRKSPPPVGYTGYAGRPISGADAQTWIDSGHGSGNIGLHLDETVLGIDVDLYEGKPGAATMRDHVDRLGDLPPTYKSTSRTDGSGIFFFRVPPGRRWASVLGRGVELTHRAARYPMVWPSIHPEGRVVRWIGPDGQPFDGMPNVADLPDLPPAWVAWLDRGDVADRAEKADVTDADVIAWLVALPPGPPCRYLARLLRNAATKLDDPVTRHDTALDYSAKVVRGGAQGHVGASDALNSLQAMWLESLTRGKARPQSDPHEWARMVVGAVALAVRTPTPEADKGCCPESPEATVLDVGDVTLADVVAATRQLHHVVDDGPIRFALAVAVSSVLDEEPLWGMNVGAPSSGKTVVQELLSGVADDQIDELTVAGLLAWAKGGKRGVPPRPVGLLPRMGERGFATIGDFSTILAGSDHNGRDQLFGDLRRVYDGKFSRNMDSPTGQPLKWTGRLTLLAAVTPEIDRFSTHTDALGPRWLYIRTKAASTDDKRAAARKARRRHQAAEQRKVIRAAAAALVTKGRGAVAGVDLTDEAHDALDDAALVACWGRASVPRQKWGRRDVDGVAVIEEPPRLVRQLVTLARCLVAIGNSEPEAVNLARRCALDTVPAARRDCLAYLADGVAATVSEIARHTRHHRDVVRRALEDLQIVGLTTCPVREDADIDQDDPPNRTVAAPWHLHGDDGELASVVLNAHRRAQR